MYKLIMEDGYQDDWLLASTVFIYRNTPIVQNMMWDWWLYQSRFYTCDQVHLPYALYKNGIYVNALEGDVFKNPYVSLVSRHK